MTFLGHGIFGAGVTALPFACASDEVKIVALSLGFFGGIAPDAADWIAATFFGADRWVLYGRMHVGDLVKYFKWFPAYYFHLEFDKIIHIYPGYNWWPRYWYLEIGLWFVGAGLIVLAML